MITEFAVSAAILILTLAGAGQVFYAEWERSKCAILAFEKVHARVTGSQDPYPKTRQKFLLEEQETHVKGEAWCGSAHEVVTLPKLESARW